MQRNRPTRGASCAALRELPNVCSSTNASRDPRRYQRRSSMTDATPNDDTRIVAASGVSDWADTADVVVVGFGIAGACAAVEARKAGADVLVLERAQRGRGCKCPVCRHLLPGRRHCRAAGGGIGRRPGQYVQLPDGEHAGARCPHRSSFLRCRAGALRLARSAGRAVRTHVVSGKGRGSAVQRMPRLHQQRKSMAVQPTRPIRSRAATRLHSRATAAALLQ